MYRGCAVWVRFPCVADIQVCRPESRSEVGGLHSSRAIGHCDELCDRLRFDSVRRLYSQDDVVVSDNVCPHPRLSGSGGSNSWSGGLAL